MTALDEITAECVKLHLFPEATTNQLAVKLFKKVSPNVTYLLEAVVGDMLAHNLKVEISGKLFEASAFETPRGAMPLANATSTSASEDRTRYPATPKE